MQRAAVRILWRGATDESRGNPPPPPFAFSFKNTKNLFIHIALIPEGDNPRVNPNILKCLLHSPVARGYRLVVIASRAMVCKTPTYYLILNSLAFARGCVILQLTHSLSSFAYFAFISSYLTLIILSEAL